MTNVDACTLVRQQLGLVYKDGKVPYKKGIDLNGNGKLEHNEILDRDNNNKVTCPEIWLFFGQNIDILPKEDAEKVVAAIAKEAKAGSAEKIRYLGQLSFQSYKYVRQYRGILEQAAKSPSRQIKAAALDALRMYDLAETAFLQAKIDQYVPFKLETDDSGLSQRQIQVKKLLIKSAKIVDTIFWQQYSHDGLALRRNLENSQDPLDKLRLQYLNINYGRYDNLEEPKVAFIGEGEHPHGATFYPEDISKAEIAAFLTAHPEMKAEFDKPNTIIRRDPVEGLVSVPYEKVFAGQLKMAAKYLREAADLTQDPALKKYLVQKADDLVSGDYYASDRDWIDLQNSTLDIIIGYMEVYDDEFSGAKASYESLVLQKDQKASDELNAYKNMLKVFQKKLPVADALKAKEVKPKPVGVFDLAYAGGDANQAIKAYAVNLPNTPEVREKFGNRFILLRNVMKAKAKYILFPIAKEIIDPSQLHLIGEYEFANFGIQHELAHSLGLDFVVDRNTEEKTETPIKLALKEKYVVIEECKGDTLTLFNLRWQNLSEEAEMRFYVTSTASIFRSIRFGVGESHGLANVIRGNFLITEGAIEVDSQTGRWKVVSIEKMRAAVGKLSTLLLEIEGYGNYEGAKKLIAEQGQVTPVIEATLAKLKGIPIDLEFVQSEKSDLTPLAAKAEKALSGLMLLKPDQKALIIYDQSKKELGEAFVAGAKALGAEVEGYLLPESRFEQGVLEEILVKINTGGYAVCINIFESRSEEVNSRLAIIKAEMATKAFVGHSPGLTKEMLGMPVDYAVMKQAKNKLLPVLQGAEKVIITTELGTNIEVKLGNREWVDDISIESAGIVNIPNGEMYYAALEDGANGTIIVDGSVGDVGLLPTPLAITFKEGKVVDMKWLNPEFKDPDKYLERIKAALNIDPMASVIGEFGIGLAPYELVGELLQDEKAAKTIHIAVGNNEGEGGLNNSQGHVDFIVKNPTVEVYYPEETERPSEKILLEGNLVF